MNNVVLPRTDKSLFCRIELNKKRLNFLSFEAVKKVSLLLMDNWTAGGDDWDREFLSSLKELKVCCAFVSAIESFSIEISIISRSCWIGTRSTATLSAPA